MNQRIFTTLFAFLLFVGSAMAQQITVSGQIMDDDTKEPAPFADVYVKGADAVGTNTDIDGKFELTTQNVKLPFTLVVSYAGYQDAEVQVTENNQNVKVSITSQAINLGEGVVVSASRTPERIMETSTTVERMDAKMIKNTPAANFYDGLENLKGVQMNTNSLTFKSVNTRGFATFANVRFVQVIDGMDNAAPGLNFPAGNLVGISELDVANAELLPGAASALYGPNAFNGILFMNSKDPYLHQGLSAMVKGGITVQNAAGTNPFGEVGIRYAKALGENERFAFKINFSALRGTDWYATDYNDMNPLNAGLDFDINNKLQNYDGVNVYGDEIATGIPLPEGTVQVARTGYQEVDLVDYEASSYKADVALHYKIKEDLQIIGNYRFGMGNSVYQGGNRYSLDNIILHQAKLELKADNFFVRAYSTIENAGNSWDTRFAAWNINRAWKGDADWFLDYVLAYRGIPNALGMTDVLAGNHDAARAFADDNRLNNDQLTPTQLATLQGIVGLLGVTEPWNRSDRQRALPGSAEFDTERDRVTALADLATGSRFIDKTTLSHVEGNYNFKNEIDFMDLQVGGNYRLYRLNSEGTIFTDSDGPIPINEFGAYVQASKTFFPRDVLKVTASLRYDKNQNFKGRISPRGSVVATFGENREHNVRSSIQTGFRNPDTQAQYIGLDLGVATLVGGAEENVNDYALDVVYTNGMGVPTTTTVQGNDIYNNSYTASSATAYSIAVAQSVAAGTPEAQAAVENAGVLKKLDLEFVKPERIISWEIGYKGIVAKKLLVDWNYYISMYEDFQANTNVVHLLEGDVDDLTTFSGVSALGGGQTRVFQLYSNATGRVTSQGVGLGLTYSLPKNFQVGSHYTFATLSFDEDADPDLIPGFNTPKHKVNVSLGNTNLWDSNIGFNLNFRWLDSYVWQAAFGNGPVDSYNALDMQISYDIKSINSTIKLGGANILNREYFQAFGASPIGAQYYVSFTYNGKK